MMITGIAQWWIHRSPINSADRARVEATDRSISPVMTIRVIGSAMIARSPILVDGREQVVAAGELRGLIDIPSRNTATSATTSADSQRSRPCEPRAGAGWRAIATARMSQAPRCCLRLRSAAASRSWMPRSSVIATISRSPAIASVHSDGTPSTLRATLIVCSSSAPRAAPTTLPLPPKIATPPTTTAAMICSSRPLAAVASIVLYCVAQKTPPRPAMRPGEDECEEHPPGDRDAGQAGGVRIGADRVQIAPGAIGAQVVRRDRHEDRRRPRRDRESRGSCRERC